MPSFDFTHRGLSALKPGATRIDYWDDSVPGPGRFGLRVTPAGVKSWCVIYRVNVAPVTGAPAPADQAPRVGVLRRYTLGQFPRMSYAKARKDGQKALAMAQAGQDPAGLKRAARAASRDTVQALFDRYADHVAVRQKAGEFTSWPDVRRSLERDVLPEWGSRLAKDIRKGDVLELVTQKAATAPVAANRLQAHIGMLFAYGMASDRCGANPVAGLRKRDERPRDRVLTADELRGVWQFLDGDAPLVLARGTTADTRVTMPPATAATLRDLFKLLVLSGQRLGETSRIAWADVDLDARVWTLPATETKNRTAHRVPLSRQALALLTARHAAAAPDARYVFPASASRRMTSAHVWAKRTAAAIARAIGVAFTAHDLRRTMATGLGELGMDEAVISLCLNHKKQGVTGRHYDLSTRETAKREALQAWADHVDAIITGTVGKVIGMRPRRAR